MHRCMHILTWLHTHMHAHIHTHTHNYSPICSVPGVDFVTAVQNGVIEIRVIGGHVIAPSGRCVCAHRLLYMSVSVVLFFCHCEDWYVFWRIWGHRGHFLTVQFAGWRFCRLGWNNYGKVMVSIETITSIPYLDLFSSSNAKHVLIPLWLDYFGCCLGVIWSCRCGIFQILIILSTVINVPGKSSSEVYSKIHKQKMMPKSSWHLGSSMWHQCRSSQVWKSKCVCIYMFMRLRRWVQLIRVFVAQNGSLGVTVYNNTDTTHVSKVKNSKASFSACFLCWITPGYSQRSFKMKKTSQCVNVWRKDNLEHAGIS